MLRLDIPVCDGTISLVGATSNRALERRPAAAGMAEVAYPLGDTEMKALAHYVSRLH